MPSENIISQYLKKNQVKIKAFAGILVIVAFFILSSYLVRENLDFVKSLIGNNFLGILIYILIVIIAIVIAPINMLPLVPIASNIFGWFYTGIFNVIGWFIGSIIVFGISRRYGIPLIRKFVSLDQLYKLESKIPKENMFISIIILRMTIPVDALSYALSLLSNVKFRTYAAATFIGIIPFSFAFAYLGTIPIYYQIFGLIGIGIVIILIRRVFTKK